ncbi:MAG: hypothetical protein AB1767_13210 [Bacillota bacterium]
MEEIQGLVEARDTEIGDELTRQGRQLLSIMEDFVERLNDSLH